MVLGESGDFLGSFWPSLRGLFGRLGVVWEGEGFGVGRLERPKIEESEMKDIFFHHDNYSVLQILFLGKQQGKNSNDL